MLTQATQEYTLNPVESNHRDGPTGHKKYPYDFIQVILADILKPETQQPIIVIILITYSPLKDLVEL